MITEECPTCEKIRKYANDLLSCTHKYCSISEAANEERFGEKILEILDKEKNDNKS